MDYSPGRSHGTIPNIYSISRTEILVPPNAYYMLYILIWNRYRSSILSSLIFISVPFDKSCQWQAQAQGVTDILPDKSYFGRGLMLWFSAKCRIYCRESLVMNCFFFNSPLFSSSLRAATIPLYYISWMKLHSIYDSTIQSRTTSEVITSRFICCYTF